jgi:hypothetical protein
VFLEFIPEVFEGAHHRLSGGLPEGAEGGVDQDAGLHTLEIAEEISERRETSSGIP